MQDYLSFLRYCLDENKPLPESSIKINWQGMMVWAEKQAIVGVIYSGVERVGKVLSMPFDTLMEWIGYAQQIENRNRLMSQRCVEVVKDYQAAGLEVMVLKGQGNATMYPNPLLRMSGDIDLWVTNAGRGRIVDFTKSHAALHEVRYYHAEYTYKGVPVEAHFMPGLMNNPIYNRRLQSFYCEMANVGCTTVELPNDMGSIPVPTWEFNVVFQLAHMMHHFFDEGIGLRQMIDYYYLLKAQSDVRSRESEVRETLKYLNLYQFAGAVMYIMKEVLGLEERYLIVPVDERRGKTLLKEILKGGNFGKHSGLTQHSAGVKYLLKTKRNLQFVREYPAEALCEPLFRTWHFFWRLGHR